jgi:hypothetical protein
VHIASRIIVGNLVKMKARVDVHPHMAAHACPCRPPV